ncbi:hypothetical protein F5Y10DRAFT_253451 [Nemania abortiva]|nr:hypothetical protein F5Y10DRAFT_253451 [Nemania abortiva]
MKIRAPQYVYELGPLLLHRQFEASKGRRSIHNIAWTRFNVVIDILSPTKSLWLIMRPEFSPRAYSHPLTGQENIDSKIPFANDDPSCDLYSYSSARLMKSIDDLRPYLSFDQSSYPAFRQGLEEVFGSTFGEDGIQIQFTVPDHDEIMREIVGEV